MLVAVSLATNYALSGALNVKLMDVCTFLAGKHLGLVWGVIVGGSTWLIYGLLNPYGVSPVITVSVMFAQSFYAIAGWAIGSINTPSDEGHAGNATWHAVAGLLSTLSYDLFTNAVFGLLFYGSVIAGLLMMNIPLPLGVIHEVANLILFPLVAVPIERRIEDLVGVRPGKVKIRLPHLERGLIVLALLSLVANSFLLSSYFYVQGENDRLRGLLSENTLEVDLLVNFGNGTRRWYNGTTVPSGSSLFNATQRIFGDDMEYAFGSYGVYLSELGGRGASPDNPSQFWVWFRWDEQKKDWSMGETSADQHRLLPGESLAWALVDFSSPGPSPRP